MLFVLPGILVIGFILLAIWWLFFRSALSHERTVQAARQREADFERLLATPGETLYCVACQNFSVGPLESDGCSHCQTRAFVIPARTSDDPRVVAAAMAADTEKRTAEAAAAAAVGAAALRESSPSPEATVEQRIVNQ
jgi:hypothetical protein